MLFHGHGANLIVFIDIYQSGPKIKRQTMAMPQMDMLNPRHRLSIYIL